MNDALRVLVVDDEAQIRRLLCAALRRAGYETVEAETVREALHMNELCHPAAALVDLGLADRDGLELVALLAKSSTCAVIVISARDATSEKVAALDLGAVDYMTKPFDTEELLARLRSALRRRQSNLSETEIVHFADVEIDLSARMVRKSGHEVHLTPKEYALLAALAAHIGRVITHANLLKSIWGPAHVEDIEYLRVTARSLRLKLEPVPSRPKHIRNEPGVGYRLCE
ncbi:MAG: response regulator [Sphingomonadales bacterium]|jgi:two-component system KDP operon response regulator KdpE|nr:response regulator [Sphingomonadales bacterium]MBK8271604.1 response regulator [Sphingomonadales bacterium]